MGDRSELIHVIAGDAVGNTTRSGVALRSSAAICGAPTKEVRS